MRNYIKLNGNNSNDITGLLIQELPPITKPKIRTQIEEINGRDGDIVTNLGYSAYNKEISIGLYGNYNVDDVIAYFNNNKTGEVIFSNEPDKFYNYEIFEQIDFDRLIRFRTATVKMHVQPFKYPTEEEQITESATVITGEGNELSLDGTKEGTPLEIGLKGNTYQETTTGKNLCPLSIIPTQTIGSLTITNMGDGTLKLNGTNNNGRLDIAYSYELEANIEYKFVNLNQLSDADANISFRDSSNNAITYVGLANSSNSYTPTTNKQITTMRLFFGTTTFNNYILKVMFIKSTDTETWEPYTAGASPNPTYPQEVQVVTGDNTIKVSNKNLFNVTNFENQLVTGKIKNDSGTEVNDSGSTYSTYQIFLKANTTYYFKGAWQRVYHYTENNVWIGRDTNHNSGYNSSYTPTQNEYIQFQINNAFWSANKGQEQLEQNSTATEYIEHQEQTYPINLGTLELCKIGTYQDYVYKSGENWYKHSKIGKRLFTENDTIGTTSFTGLYFIYASNMNIQYIIGGFNNKFMFVNDNNIIDSNNANSRLSDNQMAFRMQTNNKDRLYIKASQFSQASALLSALNGTPLYYVLATPTEEQITNAELIEQLNDILNAVSYEDQTNISQDNDNLGFIISASTSNMADITVINIGNIYAKPLMTINGSGNIEVYLNGIQVLQIALGDNQDITIDVSKMEAYNSSTQALLNRLVTGDYMKFLINSGNNTIGFRGSVTSVTIDNYTRWL